MPRKKKKPGYNPERSMEELLRVISEAYGSFDDRKNDTHEPSLNALAVEYNINVLKVRKLLITAGVYSTQLSRKTALLADEGLSTEEIAERIGLSRASVNSYLPYESHAYGLPETSVKADRAKVYRRRKAAVNKLQDRVHKNWDSSNGNEGIEKMLMWDCVIIFEGYRFMTAKKLPFTYEIKRNRSGEKSGELIFSRKAKGVTRASVEKAYDRVVEERKRQKKIIPVMETPKKLNVFGASYLYGMFLRFGLICT